MKEGYDMNLGSIERLLNKYFQNNTLHDFDDEFVMDLDLVTDVIVDWNESLYQFSKGDVHYDDLSLIDKVYLGYFPKESIIMDINLVETQMTLLDFYQFLFDEKLIVKEKYAIILFYFQKNYHKFLRAMLNPQVWSNEKRKILEEQTEDREGFTEQLIQELGKNSFKMQSADQNNKVIPVDFKKQEKTKISVSKKGEKIYQIRVDLKGFKPPIWRRLLIPNGITYNDLHLIIQNSFSWENYHLYEFRTPDRVIGEPNEEMLDFMFEELADANQILIDKDFEKYHKIDYTYDFGDDWEHSIKIEKVLDKDEVQDLSAPICTKGKGDSPLEDSRGEDLYDEFDLDIVNDILADLDI